MEDHKEMKATWMSVPQFGDWDQKGAIPDYSLDFSKIREMRKQNKREALRASMGNEDEFVNPTATMAKESNNRHLQYHHKSPHRHHSPNTRRSIFSYFNCCVKA